MLRAHRHGKRSVFSSVNCMQSVRTGTFVVAVTIWHTSNCNRPLVLVSCRPNRSCTVGRCHRHWMLRRVAGELSSRTTPRPAQHSARQQAHVLRRAGCPQSRKCSRHVSRLAGGSLVVSMGRCPSQTAAGSGQGLAHYGHLSCTLCSRGLGAGPR